MSKSSGEDLRMIVAALPIARQTRTKRNGPG